MEKKAIFFEDAYNQSLLPKITEGYIFLINTPDIHDLSHRLDPFLLKMITYNGLKSVFPMSNGVKLQAHGKTMYCMLESASYPQKHVEPNNRSTSTTAYFPYRFSECEIFFTKDNNFKVMIPKTFYESLDSFTINFPGKGDLCVLYYLFDKDLDNVVLPYIKENISYIINKQLGVRKIDADIISKKFMEVVGQFHM